MPTLGTPHRVVNKFRDGNSPVPSMTCEELHRFVQDLSTSHCFVSNFETRRVANPFRNDPPRRSAPDAAPQHAQAHMRRRWQRTNQSPRAMVATPIRRSLTPDDFAVCGTGARASTRPPTPTKPQPPLVKGARRQPRGIGGIEPGPKVLPRQTAAKLWGVSTPRSGKKKREVGR